MSHERIKFEGGPKKSYYEILGVPKNTDLRTLRRAYKILAKKYHPDLNPNDKAAEEKFKEVAEVYEVLSDAEKREAYDRNLSSRAGHAAAGGTFEQREERFWRTEVRGGAEKVWRENSTFWQQNERELKKEVKKTVIDRDGLLIENRRGIYEREVLLDPDTKQPISAEYSHIYVKDGLIMGERPQLKYLLDRNGRQISEGFVDIEKRGENIVGTKGISREKFDVLMPVNVYKYVGLW